MSTLSCIHTFLRLYFGNALSLLLAMLFGDKKNDARPDECATDTPTQAAETNEVFVLDIGPPSAQSTSPSELSGSQLLSAAAAVNLSLPSLPSILTKPVSRAPLGIEDEHPSSQSFGPPTTIFYDRRTPVCCITNIPGVTVNKTSETPKTKPEKEKKHDPASVNWSLPTRSRSSRPRSRSRSQSSSRSRSCAHPASSVGNIDDTCDIPSVSDLSALVLVDTPESVPDSPSWNDAKQALLAHVRSWNAQVQALRRHSLPVRPLALSPMKTHLATKRHSAPPVLVASSKAPCLDLEGLLSTLIQDAEQTITVLSVSESETATGSTATAKDTDQGNAETAATSSLVTIESDMIVIGDDTDNVEDFNTTSPGLPTVKLNCTPMATKSSFRLVSSISASHSLAALANASTRSIGELFNSWDDVMKSLSWNHLLSRSDGITRHNDSIV